MQWLDEDGVRVALVENLEVFEYQHLRNCSYRYGIVRYIRPNFSGDIVFFLRDLPHLQTRLYVLSGSSLTKHEVQLDSYEKFPMLGFDFGVRINTNDWSDFKGIYVEATGDDIWLDSHTGDRCIVEPKRLFAAMKAEDVYSFIETSPDGSTKSIADAARALAGNKEFIGKVVRSEHFLKGLLNDTRLVDILVEDAHVITLMMNDDRFYAKFFGDPVVFERFLQRFIEDDAIIEAYKSSETAKRKLADYLIGNSKLSELIAANYNLVIEKNDPEGEWRIEVAEATVNADGNLEFIFSEGAFDAGDTVVRLREKK